MLQRSHILLGIAMSILILIIGIQASTHRERSIQISCFSIVTFKSSFGGYGYDILENGKVKIHQPHIPSIERMQGFATPALAQQTATLVIAKMERKEFPPTISMADLEKMGVFTGR